LALFTVNAARIDPYKNYRFRVKWDGRYVLGVSKVSMLKRSTEVAKHREGNMLSTQLKMPTTTTFEPITLERGVTHDADFENWANLIYSPGAGGTISLKNFRKDIIIELLNEDGGDRQGVQRVPLLGLRVSRAAGSRRPPSPACSILAWRSSRR
jgi:phage tail-like protein